MKYVYHGSHIKGIKELEPKISTHGIPYVYAMKEREYAVVFAKQSGNDFSYYFGKSSFDTGVESNKFNLVERKEGEFKKMYSCSASIYKLPGTLFKENLTSFKLELVSTEKVTVIEEEFISNLYNEIIKLGEEGKINLYLYPNRPSYIPLDNSDLIDKAFGFYKGSNSYLEKLISFYPELTYKVEERKNTEKNTRAL